jgi:TonB family protein
LSALTVTSARSARAQDTEPVGPYQPPASTEATPPVLKKQVSAVYPPQALSERLEARVGLELTVDETGHVVDVRVTAPAGHGFDEAAVQAVQSFLFDPAKQGAQPIRSKVQFAYEFRLPTPPPAPPAPTPAPAALPPSLSLPPAKPDQVQTGEDQSSLVVAQRPPIAASENSVSQKELSIRPILRTENLTEAVPGMWTVQHAGGGKAQQYFLRGFDIDHGTDIAFSIDGMPINLVSHAHGQGFSDLHFIIPETVASLDATKGPYSDRVGDFATAGSVEFKMMDRADESTAKAEVGPGGHTRLVALESPDFGDKWRAVFAAEVFHDNGPFIHAMDFNRFNAFTKVTHALDERSEVSVTLMAYGGSWNMSGVLPARAVCGDHDGTPTPAAYQGSHCLSQFDSVDPTQGGSSQRFLGIATYRLHLNSATDIEANAYAQHYSMQLFPNDGIASSVLQIDGIQYGSQVEQDDSRFYSGAGVRVTKKVNIGGMQTKATFGFQIRNDAIHSELHRDEDRVRLDGIAPGITGPITDSEINETQIGFYADEDFRPAKWLRFVLGGRADRIDASVSNESQVAVDKVSGYSSDAKFSPKASMQATPFPYADLFLNYGRGFHSNDARTLIEGSATTLMSVATGYEVGTTIRPVVPGLTVSAVGFLLDIQSELTIDGDTASTTPSGPTRRYGGEFVGRYHFNDTVFADAAFTVAHSRYTDAADVAAGTNWVTLAPRRMFNTTVGAKQPIGHDFTLIGSVHFRSMADRAATQQWSTNPAVREQEILANTGGLTATGFNIVDLEAGVRWRFIEVVFQVFNVANTQWREGQFAVDSRLPSEGPHPLTGMSFTPGIPRWWYGHVAVHW